MKTMKKNLLLLGIFLMTLTPFLTGCDKEEPLPEKKPVIELIERGELKGTLDENYTLSASTNYQLTGSFIVNEGATLTIPAGTRITATAAAGNATETYIAVMRGARINVQGTADAPVIMTSTQGKAGDWGGLTLCGKATTTAGTDATAEVGNFKYGGTEDADNSGAISYLVIKGSGAKINSESEYNGLTLYSVGSGTKVSNVAVINGADDGVEFFGGTVSVENLYLENNEDDAIDWTEGWNGTVKNAYVKHTIKGFSTVVEADGKNNNPKIENLTAVSTENGTALQFKKQSGATITGLSLIGYTKIVDMVDGGPLANVKINGETASLDKAYDGPATVDPSSWSWAEASAIEVVELKGEVTANTTLDATKAYRLTGAYIVNNGATLTIPAGTRILAVAAEGKQTETYIAVMQGAKINIQGTAENPVIMTSPNAKPQDWGGLTICGNATTTAGVNATAEVGDFKYGGTNDKDNSGSISYLVIKGSGARINTESEYNGLTLYAVGSETKVSNVAIINGADDGVEFFGGTVSVENLYLENNEDDSIDWTEGWNGTVKNAYVVHTIDGFSTVVEADGVNNNPKIENLTAINTNASKTGTALQFKKQSGGTFTNVYLEGYSKLVDMPNNGPLANILIEGKTATLTGPYQTGKLDIGTWSWFK
ncbi:MAG TPA: hypothetical protein DIC46_03060 [Porphyromonadaceae bacterium]|jgi:hypothetical protein|nr:hypothetical protein [Porphyromonadaceae bacterium]